MTTRSVDPSEPTRTVVVWCPDWPVTAARHAAGCPPDQPVAVLDRGRVLAVSDVARGHGVRRGLRVREAQSRCAELVVLPHDPRQEARAFEPVVTAIEAIAPGVQVVRPGTCAVRARGPARFFGDEQTAARSMLLALESAGVLDARAGVAGGPFAAEQAARTAPTVDHRTRVVPAGTTAAFLADQPVSALDRVLDRADLLDLLRRLGIRTLGSLAVLPATDVLARFGIDGALAHRLARGDEDRPVVARRPPPELTRLIEFGTPLDRADQVVFSVRSDAERFVADLAHHRFVCTVLRVEAVDDQGGDVVSRSWLHPRWFSAADVVDRVRWQLEGGDLSGPISAVRLIPEEADPHGLHADGLWGGGPDEQLHRAMSRVQSRLGHRGVLVAVVGGGRGPADRQTLVPWGDRAIPARPADRPWPGRIPAPPPSTVLPRPEPAVVQDALGRSVGVDGRGVVSGEPARFSPGQRSGGLQPVAAWAGPWPVDERWWDESGRRMARFQLVGVDGSAWLFLVEAGQWWVEARYD